MFLQTEDKDWIYTMYIKAPVTYFWASSSLDSSDPSVIVGLSDLELKYELCVLHI